MRAIRTISTVMGIAAALLWSACPSALADSFPSKPVRIISPYPAGSGPDQMMRVVGEQLTKIWKQPVVLNSRAGGNGTLAMEALKAAPPDGYTIGVASDAQLTTNPYLFRSLSYDPQIDFAPVMPLFSTPFYMAVSSKGPYGSVRDLIADALSVPNKVSYGALFVGSQGHLGAALFASLVNAQMVFVPYRDAQQMLVNITNGDLSWAFTSIATARALTQSGLLKLIAVGRPTRSSYSPDTPTLAEAGGPELTVKTWLSLLAPQGTPPDVIRQINVDTMNALADPAVQERLRVFGFDSEAGSPEELAKLIVEDGKKNSELIKRIGASVQ